MTEDKFDFIIIDDSELDCFIAEKIVRHTGRNREITSFTLATQALEHILKSYPQSEQVKTIIVLDVLMPVMSGFAFVEALEKLPEYIQNEFVIVALTSSMNKNDTEKISGFKSVKYLFDKPITSEAVTRVIEEVLDRS